MPNSDVSAHDQLLAIVAEYRATLRNLGIDIKNLKSHAYFSEGSIAKGEMIANIILAARHIEDAFSRLDRALEHYNIV